MRAVASSSPSPRFGWGIFFFFIITILYIIHYYSLLVYILLRTYTGLCMYNMYSWTAACARKREFARGNTSRCARNDDWGTRPLTIKLRTKDTSCRLPQVVNCNIVFLDANEKSDSEFIFIYSVCKEGWKRNFALFLGAESIIYKHIHRYTYNVYYCMCSIYGILILFNARAQSSVCIMLFNFLCRKRIKNALFSAMGISWSMWYNILCSNDEFKVYGSIEDLIIGQFFKTHYRTVNVLDFYRVSLWSLGVLL